jgi:hypothetical protein
MNDKKSSFIKILFFVSFCMAIWASYYTKVIQSDYDILENENGIPTIEEE